MINWHFLTRLWTERCKKRHYVRRLQRLESPHRASDAANPPDVREQDQMQDLARTKREDKHKGNQKVKPSAKAWYQTHETNAPACKTKCMRRLIVSMQNQAAKPELSKYLPVRNFCQLLGISSPTGYQEVVFFPEWLINNKTIRFGSVVLNGFK